MATHLDNVVVDANEPLELARFWSAVLDAPITCHEHEVDVGLDGFDLVFVPVPEPKTGRNRVHLDLASGSVAEQEATVARVCELGATPVDIGQRNVPWVVLADPEGNEFCVLDPRDEYQNMGPLAAIVVDAVDLSSLPRFWSAATGWPIVRSGNGFVSLRSPSGRGVWLEFIAGKPKQGKNRVHLDVRPDASDSVEVARLVALGARPIDVGQADSPWTVLADPEGNEMCVLTPSERAIRAL